ncbi:MAG: porin [Burkholderiales bacterium]|nr:porin [Burkholderiales bacterium]
MKLLPLAVAVASLGAAAAQAQSSVTLFGLLDINYAHFRGQGNGSQTVLGNDGYQSSRIGFRGTEDLGGGMKAGFWLEAAMTPDDGQGGATNSNNQASGAGAAVAGRQGLTFGRRSTVSLSGSWGEVRLGRDYVPGFWNLSVFSPFGTNGVGSSGFLFYPVQGAARVTHVRASNSIGYFLPALGGFYGQAMVGLGENASNAGATEDDGKVVGLRLGYAAGALDVAVGSTRTKISALGDLTQTNAGASYDFGVAKPMLLWNENKVGVTRTKTWLVGALVPAGSAGQVRVAYSKVRTTGVANDASQWALGYVHNLSKRTALYANYSRVANRNGGTNYNVGRAPTTPGGSADGYELGVRHSF